MLYDKGKIKFKAVRAGGPGGQRTNRRSTKVQLWLKVADLHISEIEKKRIRKNLAHRINHKDEIEIVEEEERSQEANREKALKKLDLLIRNALKVKKPRIPTEPSRSAENRRIAEKKMIGEKKKARRNSKKI